MGQMIQKADGQILLQDGTGPAGLPQSLSSAADNDGGGAGVLAQEQGQGFQQESGVFLGPVRTVPAAHANHPVLFGLTGIGHDGIDGRRGEV